MPRTHFGQCRHVRKQHTDVWQDPDNLETILALQIPQFNVSVLGQTGHHGITARGPLACDRWCSGATWEKAIGEQQAGLATNRILPGALGDKLQLPVSSSPVGPPCVMLFTAVTIAHGRIKLPGAFLGFRPP